MNTLENRWFARLNFDTSFHQTVGKAAALSMQQLSL